MSTQAVLSLFFSFPQVFEPPYSKCSSGYAYCGYYFRRNLGYRAGSRHGKMSALIPAVETVNMRKEVNLASVVTEDSNSHQQFLIYVESSRLKKCRAKVSCCRLFEAK